MVLKSVVNQRILNEVIGEVCKPGEWVVLVVDHHSMRIISACCRMQDIMDKGVTLVEDIDKRRQPLRAFDAIYLLSPVDKSIDSLIEDFKDLGSPQYKAAHVFFIETLPEHLFGKLAKSEAAKMMKTMKEISIAFLPSEQLVFSLDADNALKTFFSPSRVHGRSHKLERMAEQIATLCVTLGEYPSIRYRADDNSRTLELAEMVQSRLNAYKVEDMSLGKQPGQQKSQLIILDRGFDPVSPLLHELTLQAMAYDMLGLKDGIFKYEYTSGNDALAVKEVLLDDHDELWLQLRHMHIADVLKSVSGQMKAFLQSKKVAKPGGSDVSIRELSKVMKKIPQYRKELSKYEVHMHLAEECMRRYKDSVEKLCHVEQDLAMGMTAQGEKVRDPMRLIIPVLLDQQVKVEDKLRLLLLYVVIKNGISDENLQKLVKHGQIPQSEFSTIINMQHLGVPVIAEGDRKKKRPQRKERTEDTYNVSRWVPVVKDIMEDAISGNLDSKLYPFAPGTTSAQSAESGPTGAAEARSARWTWHHKDKGHQKEQAVVARTGPRLIIFIAGGATYSELRCAYEVSSDENSKGWEVVIGSNTMISPEQYLLELRDLEKQTHTS